MATERGDEFLDRTGEERSEDDGMREHPDKARDAVRWAAGRRARVAGHTSGGVPGRVGLLGVVMTGLASMAICTAAFIAFRQAPEKRHGGRT